VQGKIKLSASSVGGQASLMASGNLDYTDDLRLENGAFPTVHLDAAASGTYKKAHYHLHQEATGKLLMTLIPAGGTWLEVRGGTDELTAHLRVEAASDSDLGRALRGWIDKPEARQQELGDFLKSIHLGLKSFHLKDAPPPSAVPPPPSPAPFPPPTTRPTQGAPTATTPSAQAPPKPVDFDLTVAISTKDWTGTELSRGLGLTEPKYSSYRSALDELCSGHLDSLTWEAHCDGKLASLNLDADLSAIDQLTLGLLDLYAAFIEQAPTGLGRTSKSSRGAEKLLRHQGARIRSLHPVLAEIYQTQGSSQLHLSMDLMPSFAGGFSLAGKLDSQVDMRAALPILARHNLQSGDLRIFWVTASLDKKQARLASALSYEGDWTTASKRGFDELMTTLELAETTKKDREVFAHLRKLGQIAYERLDAQMAWDSTHYKLRGLLGAADLRPLVAAFDLKIPGLNQLIYSGMSVRTLGGQETSTLDSYYGDVKPAEREGFIGAVLKHVTSWARGSVKAATKADSLVPPSVDGSWAASPAVEELNP
jgi:hypothetical protein